MNKGRKKKTLWNDAAGPEASARAYGYVVLYESCRVAHPGPNLNRRVTVPVKT